MNPLRRYELRSINRRVGNITAHVSWHTTERTARRAEEYWRRRSYENDGERADDGMYYYIVGPYT